MGADKPSDDATASFNKVIQDARNRRKYETLAQRIFKPRPGRGLSKGTRSQGRNTMKSALSGPRRVTARPSSTDGEWKHDRHSLREDSGDLSSRSSSRGMRKELTLRRTAQPAARLVQAFERAVRIPEAAAQVRVVDRPLSRGISIRGKAEGFTVVAENFAPGTSADDIITALQIDPAYINLLQSQPIMVFEITFNDRDNADRIVKRFDKQKADGRILKLYHKLSYPDELTADARPPSHAPKGPRFEVEARRDRDAGAGYVDGSFGFAEPMDVTMDSYDEDDRGHGGSRGGGGGSNNNTSAARANGSLYSDVFVRRSRGFDQYRPTGNGLSGR